MVNRLVGAGVAIAVIGLPLWIVLGAPYAVLGGLAMMIGGELVGIMTLPRRDTSD